MDPQQRICLEVAWEALEHAGISPNDIAGSDAAVLMGVNSDDYGRLMLEDLPGIEAWMGVGSSFCGVPNRISYLLDLHGNSIALDAACASSLIAIHHAKQLLENYESEVAVVGGVNAMCGPGLIRVLDVAGATSPEGRCRSFDAEARGYGRGEGAAVVIMKRVEDAIRDGDQILSVVKGTAVGQDGRTNGIMQPNPQAQAEVYKKALSAAGFDASTIDFVEAHATSTRVGDPKEVSAITSVYGSAAGRTAENPCYIGSVKPNVGHLEAGAGVAGVIKATLALHYRQLPPQANLQTLNPAVDWASSGLQVVRDARPWPRPDQKLRAGVCSYGYGGSISHLVLEEAPSREALKEENNGPVILTLSGPGEKWYKGQAAKLAEWLKTEGAKIPLSAIATTLSTRRAHHHVRASIVAENHEGAIASLEKLSRGIDDLTIIKARTVSGNTNNDVVWVFSGHGAQYPSMGVELLKTEPEFAKVIDTLESTYQETLGFSPRQALETGDFETTDKIQALTFAMHVGLAAVLKSRGIKPAAIIGHSVGEIAAAVTTGALTLLEGARVASIRASLYGRPDVAGKGAMILVDIPFEDVEKDCASRKDINASIHASPTSTVVSGTPEAIKEYSDYLATQQQQVRVVKSDVAFHSPLLTFLGPALTRLLGDTISPKQADIKLYSTSDLDARTDKLRNCDYWINNMLGPVWLTSAVKAAAEDGYKVFLEVSAHPLVSHSINETLMEIGEDESVVIPTIRRNHPAWEGINTALGRLHANGAVVDFKKFVGKTWVPSLPLTVWQHEKYWHEVTLDGTPGVSGSVESLAHSLHWTAAQLDSTPAPLNNVVFVANKDHSLLGPFKKTLTKRGLGVKVIESPSEIESHSDVLHKTGTVVIVLPDELEDIERLPQTNFANTLKLLEITKRLNTFNSSAKLWVITEEAQNAKNEYSLAAASMLGLARIIASEQPDLWGGLVDIDEPAFPFQVLKFIRKAGVVIVRDGVSKIPRLRALPKASLTPGSDLKSAVKIRPDGTYLITGGLGVLGLEVASWLAEKGARRLVLLSRKGLPLRSTWSSATSGPNAGIINKVKTIEALGVAVNTVSLDLGKPGADEDLKKALDNLSLPPVTGVVHAAGVMEDAFTHEATEQSFKNVLTPKVDGSWALHNAFPVGTLDFFALFSSCGQLFGFPGQGAYASGNAFLDALANYRRNSGDNTLSLMWTAWSGLGMSASTSADYIDAEMESKGITSVTRDEAFRAWEYAAKYDVPQVVVVRSLPIDEGATPAVPILNDIVARRPAPEVDSEDEENSEYEESAPAATTPSNPADLKKHLEATIKANVASVLRLSSPDDVDTHRPLSELGMDSVMTVGLRKQFKDTFKVTIPPTLIWAHPTVAHLTKWFAENAKVSAPSAAATTSSAPKKSKAPKKSTPSSSGNALPSNPVDLKKRLEQMIKADVASVLRLSSPDDVDTHRPLSELGMDSVMTVGLRKQFKDTFKVTIPPTLIWAHPTVAHLTKWFTENVKPTSSAAAAAAPPTKKSKSTKKSSTSPTGLSLPTNPAELKKHLEKQIKADVASVLRLSSPDDVDPHRPLSELGMDSVMTVGLRKQFKDTFKVTIPPTLIWAHPTVSHLCKWFAENVAK
ncbi:unnamed protein product [Tuber melanosporum]|uniref:(Perigord truffle) hypothetical protein n=1 Tax=Tuber melanosporum (strain Mel28) TaxID=656061 RepID=D5GNU1_TUBMM|nr:uncharacterized protein GSTUM_00011480001 [Tuber melanosporum]CAZ86184.1 unnamed protein product [Tuber melanosporum]